MSGYLLETPGAGLDPNNPDTDGDGLLDGLEVNTHDTNPALADTDGDGALDGMEVYQGSDPKDAGSKPAINLLVNGSTAVPPVSTHGTDLLEIKLENASGGAVMMFTLDGSDPVTGGGTVYSGPFSVNEPVSIRAVSLDASFNKVAELKPVILNVMPVVSETVGEKNTYLKLTAADSESTIYYTIDGSDPLQKGVKYEGPLYVKDAGTIVRAVAYKGTRDGLVVADKVTVEELPGYSLSVTTTGGGSVAADPWKDKYLAGTKVKLTATPTEGWQFMGWKGKAAGSQLETEITINGDTDVSAQFGTGLTLTAIGGGKIKANPERELYSHGSTVQLSAVPDDGKYLVMWGGDKTGSEPVTGLEITKLTPTVSALFGAVPSGKVTLSLEISGNGKVSVDPNKNLYDIGESVMISATPQVNSGFAGYSGDVNSKRTVVTVTLDKQIKAKAQFFNLLTSVPITSANVGSVYSYSITTVAPDVNPMDPPVLTGTSLPAWLTLVDNGDGTGTLSGTPQSGDVGDHAIRLDVSLLDGVTQIYSNIAFAALKADGSVVTWGLSSHGGDSSAVSDDLSSGVTQIYSTGSAFAAFKADGSVVTWGSSEGGDSSAVSDDLSSGVTQIYSTENAFAALKDDGSVVTWGPLWGGGDSSGVSDDLSSGVTLVRLVQ